MTSHSADRASSNSGPAIVSAATLQHSIKVELLTASIGAEVRNVHLGAASRDPQLVTELRRLLLQHRVLFFRDQDISRAEHVAFARHFGELEDHPVAGSDPEHPGLVRIYKDLDSKPEHYENAWHYDATWRVKPPMGCVLRCVETPPVGGDTIWCNMVEAYRRRPEDIQHKINGLRARHSIEASFGAAMPVEARLQLKQQLPDAEHPVVRTHPETGGPEVLQLETVDVGAPGPGRARVRHRFVAVTFIDIYIRTGFYPAALPSGLGSDAVGVVEAVGAGVSDVRVGDRVGYLLRPQGAYAEVRVMPAEVLIPLPAGVSDRTASALTMKGMTAQYLFRQVYPLQGGERLAVGDSAGDGSLCESTQQDAGDGRGTLRARVGWSYHRRAAPGICAGRCSQRTSRARIATDRRRHGAGALSRCLIHGKSAGETTAATPAQPLQGYLYGSRAAWFAFELTVALMICDYADRQVIVSLFPHLKSAWGLSDQQLGLLASIVSVTVALAGIPVALVADRISRVGSVVLMASLWSLASISCRFVSHYPQLLAARAIVGFGEAGYGSVGAALVASHFPVKLRGTVLAGFFASASIGSVLGVLLALLSAACAWGAFHGTGTPTSGGAVHFALIVATGIVMTCTVGPVAAIVIDVVPAGLRATGAAVLSLLQNLLGFAAGPAVICMLSDHWGLAAALRITPLFPCIAAVLFWCAVRGYERDRAPVTLAVTHYTPNRLLIIGSQCSRASTRPTRNTVSPIISNTGFKPTEASSCRRDLMPMPAMATTRHQRDASPPK